MDDGASKANATKEAITFNKQLSSALVILPVQSSEKELSKVVAAVSSVKLHQDDDDDDASRKPCVLSSPHQRRADASLLVCAGTTNNSHQVGGNNHGSSSIAKNVSSSSQSSKTKKKPARKSSSSFGFKKGFLDNNTSSASPPLPSSTGSRFRAPQPGRDECPICYHVLPLASVESIYKSCCGKMICFGCIVGRERAQLEESGRIIKGRTPEDVQFMLIYQHGLSLCPFCRTKDHKNDEEIVQKLHHRISIRSEDDYTTALVTLGSFYSEGEYGLSKDHKKAEQLYTQAYDLDDPTAAWNLYSLYHEFYPDQNQKMMEYLRRGEILGNLECVQELIDLARHDDNSEDYAILYIQQARMGGTTRDLMPLYRDKLISKDDVATTLRLHRSVNDEMKTAQREYGRRYQNFFVVNSNDKIIRMITKYNELLPIKSPPTKGKAIKKKK